ncbi:MAG: DUF917 domain-containing protein [archaeon YNP-WB-062]|nr:DUF917 domain-containing protein [Candidatus Culexarchaeum yellowstonense]
MRLLNYSDVKHLIIGATILGVGGGGDPDRGFKLLCEDLNCGRSLKLCSFDELNLDSYVATPYFAGSMPSPKSKSSRKSFTEDVMLKALKILESVLGSRLEGFVATEIGGGNTAIALHLASILNLPLLDGDQAGRSVPELTHSTYYLNGLSLAPSVIASPHGDYIIFKEYSSINSYEGIVRGIASQVSGSVFVIDSPVKVDVARRVAINGSVSRAIEIGEVVDEAKSKGLDVASKIAEKLNGYVIFEGVIDRYELNEVEGFLIGNVYVKGFGKHTSSTLRIWVKNENIFAWMDEEPIAMPPDLIIMLNEDGYGVVNSKINVGMKVKIVVAPGPREWRTPRGLEIIGPRSFGLNYDYKPVELLVKERHLT